MPEETRSNDEQTRPITLYVERVITDPNMQFIERRRLSSIDIEISCQDAEQLIEYLRKRNCQGLPGAIRVRLLGRLILS